MEFDLSETIKDLEVTVFSENQDKRKVKVSRADEISVSYRGIGRCNLPITVHFKQYLNILPIKINQKSEYKGKWQTQSIKLDMNKI